MGDGPGFPGRSCSVGLILDSWDQMQGLLAEQRIGLDFTKGLFENKRIRYDY